MNVPIRTPKGVRIIKLYHPLEMIKGIEGYWSVTSNLGEMNLQPELYILIVSYDLDGSRLIVITELIEKMKGVSVASFVTLNWYTKGLMLSDMLTMIREMWNVLEKFLRSAQWFSMVIYLEIGICSCGTSRYGALFPVFPDTNRTLAEPDNGTRNA